MQRAEDCAIGLPINFTSSFRMLALVRPPEVRRNFTVPSGNKN
jgi:hypothetical protein